MGRTLRILGNAGLWAVALVMCPLWDMAPDCYPWEVQ